MFFTESWITDDHSIDEYSFLNFQAPVHCNRPHGGVLIFARANISFKEVYSPHPMEDASWIEVKTSNSASRLYGCVYRSPNSSSVNNELLLKNLEWANTNFKEIVILGDFNLPTINWDLNQATGSYPNSFLESVSDKGLHQVICKETRFRFNQNPSILDLLLTSDDEMIEDIQYLPSFGKSDHILIAFSVKNEYRKVENKAHVYNFRKTDIEMLNELMNSEKWRTMFDISRHLEESTEDFIHTTTSFIESTVPKYSPKQQRSAPWSTKVIQKLAAKKRKKWDAYSFDRTNETKYNEYKAALNEFNSQKTKEIKKYEKMLLENKDKNPKSYYKYMSKKNKYASKILVTYDNGTPELDDEKSASILNDFYISVFKERQSSTPKLTTPRVPVSMPEIVITEEKVKRHLERLNPRKSSGPDNIPAILLKNAADAFKVPLTIMFNRSYNEGYVPSALKNANITPIFKGGKVKTANHFRPISLTPVIAKVEESIFKEDLEEFLDKNNIICQNQHGFRRARSTNSNLINTWNQITDWADDGKAVSIIYTDFRKAFDSVPKELLLLKLENLGIRGKNLNWLSSFVSDRTQQVVINGKKSSTKPIKTACPQGGVLSGLLFSIYINDLPDVIQNSQITMYADDAKIFAPITDQTSIQNQQSDLDNIGNWSTDWRLDLNIGKCIYLFYAPIGYKNGIPKFTIQGKEIERKKTTSDLGVTISDNLKFHDQVNKVCRNANLEIGRVRRSFISRSPQFLRNAYQTYVRPITEFNVEVWNPVYKGDQLKMEKVQNKLTKLMNYGKTMTPVERNRIMKITSHQQRRLRGDLITMYKNIDNEVLFPKRIARNTRGHSKTVAIRRIRTEIKKHSIAHRSVTIWNDLPENIVSSPTLNIFKRRLDILIENLE